VGSIPLDTAPPAERLPAVSDDVKSVEGTRKTQTAVRRMGGIYLPLEQRLTVVHGMAGCEELEEDNRGFLQPDSRTLDGLSQCEDLALYRTHFNFNHETAIE